MSKSTTNYYKKIFQSTGKLAKMFSNAVLHFIKSAEVHLETSHGVSGPYSNVCGQMRCARFLNALLMYFRECWKTKITKNGICQLSLCI